MINNNVDSLFIASAKHTLVQTVEKRIEKENPKVTKYTECHRKHLQYNEKSIGYYVNSLFLANIQKQHSKLILSLGVSCVGYDICLSPRKHTSISTHVV